MLKVVIPLIQHSEQALPALPIVRSLQRVAQEAPGQILIMAQEWHNPRIVETIVDKVKTVEETVEQDIGEGRGEDVEDE